MLRAQPLWRSCKRISRIGLRSTPSFKPLAPSCASTLGGRRRVSSTSMSAALASACLVLCLSSCASSPAPARIKTVYVLPPAEWMQVQGVPPLRGDTWADLAVFSVELAGAQLSCEMDDAAMLRWAKRHEANHE
jgi:hypothetical protein